VVLSIGEMFTFSHHFYISNLDGGGR